MKIPRGRARADGFTRASVALAVASLLCAGSAAPSSAQRPAHFSGSGFFSTSTGNVVLPRVPGSGYSNAISEVIEVAPLGGTSDIAPRATGEILVMNHDGNRKVNLTNHPASDFSPAWSPDGTKIAFVRKVGANPEIFVMKADGSAQRNLTKNPAPDYGPAWSPDGRKIAFARGGSASFCAAGARAEMYVMNADGSGQRMLVSGPFHSCDPAWSLDGSRITYTRYGGIDGIYVVNADGSGQTLLVQEVGVRAPAWSPDGSRIAFTRRDDLGCSYILVMNADGSGQRYLTDKDWYWRESDPAWSPDGKSIAFSSMMLSLDCEYPPIPNLVLVPDITVVNVDGAGRRSLTRTGGREPAWSPDGGRIAFTASRQCRVPNVTGQTLPRARAMVRRAGCTVGGVRYVRSERSSGHVVRQSPRAGTRLGGGARVSLVVSRRRT